MPPRRHTTYLNHRLQGQLILAFLTLEISMVLISMVYLYLRFSSVIEDNLYTIHKGSQENILQLLLQELGWLVLVMGIINTLALLIGHRLWMRQINSVLEHFRTKLEQIDRLYLPYLTIITNPVHELSYLIETWIYGERRRVIQLNEQIMQLSQADTLSSLEREQIRAGLLRCQTLLQHQKNVSHPETLATAE